MTKTIVVLLFGDIDKVGSKRFFVSLTCFVASIFFLGRTSVHFLMGLPSRTIIIGLTGVLFTIGLYFLVRYTRLLLIPMLLLTLLGLFLLDLAWYSKYMSHGPTLYFILIFGALVLWMWDGRMMFILMAVYYLNFLALFLIESSIPNPVYEYPDNDFRISDTYLGVVLDSLLLSFLLYVVKLDFNRKHEKAIRSDKLKSAFLANMSHEIRTPMNAIVGFSNLLTKEADPAEFELYVNIIRTNGDNLLRLINDIIDLSKIEAGDMEIIHSEVNLHELLEDCHAYFSIELKNRGKNHIDFSLSLPEEPLVILSDYTRLKQVLSNLLSNAVKFTSEGSISLGYKRIGREIVLLVSDTGTGIPEEDQDKIFNRFTTFDYEGMNTEGSGIGLSIVENILLFLGGSVRFTSSPGLGTTFFASIPFVPPSNNHEKINKPIITMKTNSDKKSGRSILLVEDEIHSRELLIRMLRPLNMEIYNVSDGNDAIRHVIMNPDISLILMDLKLPYLDGYEAARMIKKMNPEIPIIAQTAYAMAGDREKALAAGCDDYIAKPISSGTLLATVNQYLQN